jgi:hypothetical protein
MFVACGADIGGKDARMKKPYAKPVLAKRERLSAVSAQVANSDSQAPENT